MKIFDIHTHVFPDAIAANTLRVLAAASGGITPHFDGTRAGMLRQMASDGITASLNCPIATKPSQVDTILNWSAQQSWPLISLGSLHPDSPDKPALVAKAKALGLPGLKLHPEYQAFRVTEERVQELWRACEAEGMVVLLHAGNDIAYKPPCNCPPEDLAWLVNAYPRLKVIAAHFGGWNLWHELDPLIGTSVNLDFSMTLGYHPDDRLLELARRHGTGKILFGSDTPWDDPVRALNSLRSIGFSAAELQAICWDNAIRLLGIPPEIAGNA